MATTTVYFDGHVGIVDMSGVWTNDSNAANGNTTDYASTSNYSSSGSNRLLIKGTSALPGGITTITSVRARVYAADVTAGYADATAVYITAAGNSSTWPIVSLGYCGSSGGVFGDYGPYGTVASPGGSWTVSDLANLECSLGNADDFGSESRVYRVELEITYPSVNSGKMLMMFQ